MVSDLSVGYGRFLRSMHREEWGARTPGDIRRLEYPVDHIRLTDTGSAGCCGDEECCRVVRLVQEQYMDIGLPDIPYNFLVGGDGTVYRGRGWYRRAHPNIWNDWINNRCIEIAYIGDFDSKEVPFTMLSSALDLIKYGVKGGMLSMFFKVLEFKSRGRLS